MFYLPVNEDIDIMLQYFLHFVLHLLFFCQLKLSNFSCGIYSYPGTEYLERTINLYNDFIWIWMFKMFNIKFKNLLSILTKSLTSLLCFAEKPHQNPANKSKDIDNFVHLKTLRYKRNFTLHYIFPIRLIPLDHLTNKEEKKRMTVLNQIRTAAYRQYFWSQSSLQTVFLKPNQISCL